VAPSARRGLSPLAGWRCPKCDRLFRRTGQSHECAPAMTLDDYFSTGPPHERPVFDAVFRHLESVGPFVVEPVSVGIFLKRSQTFAALRPMQKWVALSFMLPREVRHETITRRVVQYHGRYYHVANIRSPEDLDDRLLDWLTEAYLISPE